MQSPGRIPISRYRISHRYEFLQAGETSTLGYTFSFPKIPPPAKLCHPQVRGRQSTVVCLNESDVVFFLAEEDESLLQSTIQLGHLTSAVTLLRNISHNDALDEPRVACLVARLSCICLAVSLAAILPSSGQPRARGATQKAASNAIDATWRVLHALQTTTSTIRSSPSAMECLGNLERTLGLLSGFLEVAFREDAPHDIYAVIGGVLSICDTLNELVYALGGSTTLIATGRSEAGPTVQFSVFWFLPLVAAAAQLARVASVAQSWQPTATITNRQIKTTLRLAADAMKRLAVALETMLSGQQALNLTFMDSSSGIAGEFATELLSLSSELSSQLDFTSINTDRDSGSGAIHSINGILAAMSDVFAGLNSASDAENAEGRGIDTEGEAHPQVVHVVEEISAAVVATVSVPVVTSVTGMPGGLVARRPFSPRLGASRRRASSGMLQVAIRSLTASAHSDLDDCQIERTHGFTSPAPRRSVVGSPFSNDGACNQSWGRISGGGDTSCGESVSSAFSPFVGPTRQIVRRAPTRLVTANPTANQSALTLQVSTQEHDTSLFSAASTFSLYSEAARVPHDSLARSEIPFASSREAAADIPNPDNALQIVQSTVESQPCASSHSDVAVPPVWTATNLDSSTTCDAIAPARSLLVSAAAGTECEFHFCIIGRLILCTVLLIPMQSDCSSHFHPTIPLRAHAVLHGRARRDYLYACDPLLMQDPQGPGA